MRGNRNADIEKARASNPRVKKAHKKAPTRKAVSFESGTRTKPGAPKGSMNNAKNIVPAIRRLQRGQFLPPKYERVTAIAELEGGELVSDRGGVESMSAAEMLKIGIWKCARSCELLCLLESMEQDSAFTVDENGVWDMQPGLQRISQFLSIQNKCLNDLGLDRKPRSLQDVQAFVKENYSEKAPEKEEPEKL